MSTKIGNAKSRDIFAIAVSLIVTGVLCVPLAPAAVHLQSSTAQGVPVHSASFASDIIAQPTPQPGYMNGRFAAMDGTSVANASPLLGVTCSTAPFALMSFSTSKNYGNPPLLAGFEAVTRCGSTPFSASWTFGDGNITTSGANVTYVQAGLVYEEFFYNHTYRYVGAFVPKVVITDNSGAQVNGSADVFASFVPELYYNFYNESGLIRNGITGAGASIGLTEQCYPGITPTQYQNDLSAFDAKFGLPSTTLNFVYAGGSSCGQYSSWDYKETEMDFEWAHVAAPGARIYVCLGVSSNVSIALASCVSLFYQNRAEYSMSIVSNSWGFCAVGASNTDEDCVNNLDPNGSIWESAELANMTLFASTGDFVPDSSCVSVNYDSANPYGIAVGGTTISSVGSSGSYGSESVWANHTKKFVQCTTNADKGVTNYMGETYGTNPYYNAPSWQHTDFGFSERSVPDVSMNGNSTTGVPILAQGQWYIGAGTSLGSPIWAGILAVLLSANAPGLSGFAGPFLYAHGACFHSVSGGASEVGLGTPNVGCLARA